MARTCYRCDSELEEPIEDNANYVIGEDTVEETDEGEDQRTGLVCPNCVKDDDNIIW